MGLRGGGEVLFMGVGKLPFSHMVIAHISIHFDDRAENDRIYTEPI